MHHQSRHRSRSATSWRLSHWGLAFASVFLTPGLPAQISSQGAASRIVSNQVTGDLLPGALKVLRTSANLPSLQAGNSFGAVTATAKLVDVAPSGDNSGNAQKGFRWPGSARCAVSLTYDDAIDVHLDTVAPDLEAAGLRGTFFVPGRAKSLEARMDEWRSLAWQGHEIGNHSLFHPCVRLRPDGSVYDWLPSEYDAGKYSPQQMAEELRVMNALLQALDGRKTRTFAYPCAEFLAGGKSYVEEIRPLFTAARLFGEIPDNMRDLDLHLVPSWSVRKVGGQELIAYAERAESNGTLAVYMFHGVGGGHSLNVTREAHQELIAFLNANRHRFWTATFAEITHHVRGEKRRLGWEN